MPRIYDVSLPLSSGGVVYPGNPPIVIEPQQEISKGDSANVSSLSFGSHTGTHVDAPRHILDGTTAVDQIPLEAMMGPAIVLEFGEDVSAVTADHLRASDLTGYRRVLLKTRNSLFVRSGEFKPDYTFLAPDGAEYLVSLGVTLVGVDYFSVEKFHSGHHKTHKTLLGHQVVIVEGLDLAEPPAGVYEFICLPLRIAGGDGAPARAVLLG